MTKRMLIDGTHAEEIRVVVADDNKIDDFEVETAGKTQLKGNLYVAEVDRVEASLQAAFLRYGGQRNGFLAFSEVHPQWFDLEKDEKNELLQELQDLADRRRGNDNAPDEEVGNAATESHDHELSEAEQDEDARAAAIANSLNPEDTSTAVPSKAPRRAATAAKAEEAQEEKPKEAPDNSVPNTRKPPIHRRYRIEQVLKPGMKILVQITKEERGGKGAAMTTYYALAGRFSVLMPNTPYAGGISRKINDSSERKPLREIFNKLDIPRENGLIIRTAGVGQDQKSIQGDVDSLLDQWKGIQKSFDKEDNLACVHEDASLVARAIRDMFNEDVEEIVIAGRRIYRQAKDHAKTMVPEAAKKMKEHRGKSPIFTEYTVEQKLNKLHHTRVVLPSGGYLIIDPTEALVSVDVNSGSATQGSNIEETALKTNLEAAEELARQIRLRDLAGLIVVDFIDMDHRRHNGQVERAMRKLARKDRARMQVGDISNFGLMEISRQRLRPSLNESTFITCPHCQGSGSIVSNATAALMILRRLEENDIAGEADRVIVHTSAELSLYILNHKRALIQDLEAKYKYQIQFMADATVMVPDMKLELVRVKADGTESSSIINVELREKPYEPPEVRYSKKKHGKPSGGNKGSDKKERKPRTRKENTKKDAKADDAPTPKATAGKKPAKQAKKSAIKRLTKGSKPVDGGTEESAEAKPAEQSAVAAAASAASDKPVKTKAVRRLKTTRNTADEASTEESKAKKSAKSDEKSSDKPKAKRAPRKASAKKADDKADNVETLPTAEKGSEEKSKGTFQRWWGKS